MVKKNHNCFVATIDIKLAEKLRRDLVEQGFTLSQPQYTIFQAQKKGLTCTLYQSGKLTVQGKEKHDFISFYLEPEILKELSYSYPEANVNMQPRIGVDEAGKGDYYGPLCIASLYADEEGIKKLIKMDVRDSKQMTDKMICSLAIKIIKSFDYSIIQIFPQKYNELYAKFKNLNRLLAWGHATAIENLVKKTECPEVIIDQFAYEHVVESALKSKALDVKLTQKHRGEEDIVVAGASIIARYYFVEGIDKLSQTYHIKLPKGANFQVIKTGKELISKHGKEILKQVAKIHFKTTDQILAT